MKIQTIRASVIGRATEFIPTRDFPVPDSLVDHYIFTTAEELIKQDARIRRSFEIIEPWMVSKFECLPVKEDNPKCFSPSCESRYVLDLPFQPMSFLDDRGIVGVFLQDAMVPVRYLPIGRISTIDHIRDRRPSYERPMFTRMEGKLYFIGGDRDFKRCKILIHAAVSGVDPAGLGENVSCNEGMAVPIPGGMIPELEKRVVQTILQGLNIGNTDLVEDGVEREEA